MATVRALDRTASDFRKEWSTYGAVALIACSRLRIELGYEHARVEDIAAAAGVYA
jgi:hypothetical protein